MKTPPKTSLNNQTLEEDIQLILDRMHHKIVHNETLKIDPPHKIDKTCPYKCTRDATKAIQELFTRECEKARIDELKRNAHYIQARLSDTPQIAGIDMNRTLLEERIAELSALQPSNKETIQ